MRNLMRDKSGQPRWPLRSMTLVQTLAFAICISASATATEAQVPGELNIRTFCNAVDSKVPAGTFSHDTVLYFYQDMLVEAAGVSASDSPEIAYGKIRLFMDANSASLVCNLTNFNPRNGNVYKLAVARQFDGFIHDALDNWHVDLNQVDVADSKTVLDYITDRRATAGPTYARTLDRYYARFRAAGARHARELR